MLKSDRILRLIGKSSGRDRSEFFKLMNSVKFYTCRGKCPTCFPSSLASFWAWGSDPLCGSSRAIAIWKASKPVATANGELLWEGVTSWAAVWSSVPQLQCGPWVISCRIYRSTIFSLIRESIDHTGGLQVGSPAACWLYSYACLRSYRAGTGP
jgi:hypothetical protein